MKLYAVYTEGTLILRDILLKSLKDDFVAILLDVGAPEHQTFGSPGFLSIIRKKIALIVESIRENMGDIIVWSDIDIQFFRKFSHEVESLLEGKDIVFQAEFARSKVVNGGFYILRCNDRTLSLFQELMCLDIEDKTQFPFFEQSALNHLLSRGSVRWSVLDERFYARSHGETPPVNAILHHANCTMPVVEGGKIISSMDLKLRQMKEVRMRLGISPNSPASEL